MEYQLTERLNKGFDKAVEFLFANRVVRIYSKCLGSFTKFVAAGVMEWTWAAVGIGIAYFVDLILQLWVYQGNLGDPEFVTWRMALPWGIYSLCCLFLLPAIMDTTHARSEERREVRFKEMYPNEQPLTEYMVTRKNQWGMTVCAAIVVTLCLPYLALTLAR